MNWSSGVGLRTCSLVAAGALLLAVGAEATPGRTQTVEVFASDGVLLARGPNEAAYRNVRPGTTTLASGSFLRTKEGPADILFEADAILCLDSHTEVQVGLYGNGIWIYQYRGQAYHIVEPGPDFIYAVQTAFYTAFATGTEYRTWVDYPVEGAILVAWGHVGVIVPQWTDPGSGATSPGITGFVPEGYKIVGPLHGEADSVAPGYRVYRPSASDKVVRGEKVAPPPDDDWTRERRALGRTVRDLRERHARGLLGDEDLRRKMLLALGFPPRLLPVEPMEPEGGFWIGESDYLILALCIGGSVVSEVKVVDAWVGRDKKTGETYPQFVNFTLSGVGAFFIDRAGRVDGSYTVGEGLWKGTTVEMRGWIGSRSGRVWVSIYSETDAAVYSGSIGIVEIRLVDPRGCNF